jgi:thioredoxin-related protein
MTLPRKGLFYMRNIIILSLFFVSVSVNSDMNQCSKTTNQDDKNYCLATYSGSSMFCEKLKSFERRTQCMRMVVAKQRQMQYGVTKQKEKQEGE